MHLSDRAAPRGVVAAASAEDVLHRWRLDELVRAGYEPWDALVLSRRPEIDLHAAIDLVRHGCPSRTAVRILI